MKAALLASMAALFVSVPGLADDVSGAQLLLCSAAEASLCATGASCESGVPSTLNIPSFIEIDLDKRELRTTAASEEQRRTEIQSLRREDGLLVLQGLEGGRAYSFVISEQTGLLTVAVAREEMGVVVHGACTPLGKP